MERQQMTGAVLEGLLARLNPEQRCAVATLEGPVLVMAGPGTGKTEILATRIVNILASTQTDPSSILCLTYTDAGTVAMRKRLVDFIGPDAHKIEITTFHGFCNQVIQEQGDHFGFKYRTAASDVDRYRIACSIIDTFPADHPLTRSTGELYYDASRLLGLFEIMKKEGWTIPWLLERIERYADGLPHQDEYVYKRRTKQPDGSYREAGEINEQKLMKAQHELKKLAAAVVCFEQYTEYLAKQGMYDFADMLLWCRQAFHETPELLAVYQERYLYLLVDELQDTSGAQFDILMQLVDYWDAPNLFMVGDDDQSIFRFQGASIENLLAVVERYAGSLQKVSLRENYRSSQLILDAARSLIQFNTERLDPDKVLHAANPPLGNDVRAPEILRYQSPFHEACGTAERIRDLLATGVAPHEVAVIYRNHSQAGDLLEMVRHMGIPVQSRKKVDILQEPLIHRLERVLAYLHKELVTPHSAEQLLFEILHDPWFGIAPLTLARVAFEMRTARGEGGQKTWRDSLMRRHGDGGQLTLFTRDDQDRLAAALTTLEELVRTAAVEPLVTLLHRIITELGFVAEMLASEERMWHLELLSSFYNLVRDEAQKKPFCLTDLLQLLGEYRRNAIAIEVEQLSGSREGVVFLTAHGSKGLEFEHVFLIGGHKSVWDTPGRRKTFALPPTVFHHQGGAEIEEARRLFYVAMTRAKRGLSISYAGFAAKGAALEESMFIAELLAGKTCTEQDAVVDEEALVTFGGILLGEQKKSLPDDFIDHTLLDERLRSYSLSVSHVNAFLQCPVSFYFSTLLRVPTPPYAAMVFGSAVHHAIEQVYLQMKRHPRHQFPDTGQFTAAFEWYFRRFQELLPPVEYRRRMDYGMKILPAFYQEKQPQWRADGLVEFPIRNVVYQGVPLNGKLDLVEPQGLEVRVVDFKTGALQNITKKLKPPTLEFSEQVDMLRADAYPMEGLGGDYWRQAVFYRILVEQEPKRSWKMAAARFDFVEPQKVNNRFESREVVVTDHDVVMVAAQIQHVYHKIMNHDFGPGCGQKDCSWCNFIQRYQKSLRP